MLEIASQKKVARYGLGAAFAAALAALPLVAGGPAFAADAKGGDAPAQMRQHHRLLPSETIDARLAFLKTALKITDAQGRQWNALADVMRKRAKERDALITAHRAYESTDFHVMDRLERRQKMMTKGAQDLAEFIAAAKPLYATFSDEQKRLADEFLAPRFGGRFQGRRFHRGG